VGNKSEDVAVAGPGADSERADGLESNRECRYEIYEDGMLLSYAALAVIQDLQDAYWDSVDKEDYLENSLAEGRIFLSLHVMDKLQKHAKLIRGGMRRICKPGGLTRNRGPHEALPSKSGRGWSRRHV